MSSEAIRQLTAPGGPFEFTQVTINDMQCKVFKDTPLCITSIFSALEQYEERDLAVYAQRRLTYRQAIDQAALLAQHLNVAFGIGKGNRVAIAMRNAPEWLVAFLAVTSLGAIPALVNSRGTADEIAYCITSTQCGLVLTDMQTEEGLDETSAGQLPRMTFDLTQMLTLKGETRTLSHSGRPPALLQAESDPDETALILFTSGTTGRPKGALLTHRGVLTALRTNQYSSAIIGIRMAEKYGIDLQTLAANQPQPCTLLMFPLFHVSGCEAVFLTGILQGAKIVMMPKWNGSEALRLIESEKITMFPGVPTMYWDMLRTENRKDFNVQSLVSLSVAGQSTPLPLFAAIKEAFPNAIIGCGYGMTETNGAISLIIGEDLIENPTSVGHAVATAEIKLMKDETAEAAIGERGEICVRGATVMKGYDNRPDANEKSFADGWYRTGDIGVFDENNMLYIVDRSTEMVISGGENIYCAEVERVLNQATDVLEAVTFGMPDDRLGEKLIALIRTHEGSTQSVEGILDFVRQGLAVYKLPAEVYLIDEPLPRNATGKVLKNSARELYKNLNR